MTRKDLINALIDIHPDWPPLVVEQAARIVLDSIAQALIQGRDVEIRGLGAFRVRHYEPKPPADNVNPPKYNKRWGLVFKPGLNIMRALNNQGDNKATNNPDHAGA